MPKVSIIVPIYNKASYIEEFLDSLINQTLQDIEIVLVDDGSKDNSLAIAKDYQKIDSRIKIISQKNQGVSVARNTGIENAIGEYLGFADPDDRLAEDMFEKMYNKCIETNSPVCMSNYYQETKKDLVKREIKTSKEVLNKQEINQEILSKMIGPLDYGEETIMSSVWRLLIKREIVIEHDITFPIGISRMQDLAFSIELFIHVDQLCIERDYLYFYKVHDDSATSVYDVNTFTQLTRILPIVEEMLVRYDIEHPTVPKRLNNRYLYIGMKSISNEAKSNNPKSLKETLKAIKDICSHEKVKKAIHEIDIKSYPFKQKIVLNAIKNNNLIVLLSYYRLAQILFH